MGSKKFKKPKPGLLKKNCVDAKGNRTLTLEEKYGIYEISVQDPEEHIRMFNFIHSEVVGRAPRILREDFCGTFWISTEWVKSNSANEAICLDLDSEPLAHGKVFHYKTLNSEQKKRIEILKQNVISVTMKKADIVAACNFSFYIFKERNTLVDYFRKALASLTPGGVFILEMAGGPGFIEKDKERRTVKSDKFGKFQYMWHQKSFNPITHDGLYSINFKFPDGSKVKDAFVYDWRVWTLPEIFDAMRDAGFVDPHVYWEEEDEEGEGTGEYVRTTEGDSSHSWITYAVGVKPKKPVNKRSGA